MCIRDSNCREQPNAGARWVRPHLWAGPERGVIAPTASCRTSGAQRAALARGRGRCLLYTSPSPRD
eukprot:1364408-Alexandrium_andersonii.AAC.1